MMPISGCTQSKQADSGLVWLCKPSSRLVIKVFTSVCPRSMVGQIPLEPYVLGGFKRTKATKIIKNKRDEKSLVEVVLE